MYKTCYLICVCQILNYKIQKTFLNPPLLSESVDQRNFISYRTFLLIEFCDLRRLHMSHKGRTRKQKYCGTEMTTASDGMTECFRSRKIDRTSPLVLEYKYLSLIILQGYKWFVLPTRMFSINLAQLVWKKEKIKGESNHYLLLKLFGPFRMRVVMTLRDLRYFSNDNTCHFIRDFFPRFSG